MKIRNGFVSNSSSASYIIEIRGIDYDNFIDIILREYEWDFFSRTNMKHQLEKKLASNEQYVKEGQLSKEPFWFNGLARSIKRDEELLKEIENFSVKEIAKIVLERNNITIIDDGDDIELRSETSMHNDFDTGIPKILKEIILYFIFETSHKVKCNIRHDN